MRSKGKASKRGAHNARLAAAYAKISLSHMPEQNSELLLTEFGRRVQRCYGCFVAFHLKDMYLGEDVSFYCENCRDESMFHFDDFSKLMDPAKLRESSDEHHHH